MATEMNGSGNVRWRGPPNRNILNGIGLGQNGYSGEVDGICILSQLETSIYGSLRWVTFPMNDASLELEMAE